MQTALITGASRGLGRALALDLAADGWTLVVDARDPSVLRAAAEEFRTAGASGVHSIAGDVADQVHRAALTAAVAALDGLDLLVHNASALGPTPLPGALDLDPDALRTLFEVNVVAPLALTQALVPHFLPGATVLSITSDAAVEPYPGWGGYGASKAALEQLTRVLAVERPDLRVHVVDPGDMRTAMHAAAFPGEDISDRPPPETSVPGIRRIIGSEMPSGRYVAREVERARVA